MWWKLCVIAYVFNVQRCLWSANSCFADFSTTWNMFSLPWHITWYIGGCTVKTVSWTLQACTLVALSYTVNTSMDVVCFIIVGNQCSLQYCLDYSVQRNGSRQNVDLNETDMKRRKLLWCKLSITRASSTTNYHFYQRNYTTKLVIFINKSRI